MTAKKEINAGGACLLGFLLLALAGAEIFAIVWSILDLVHSGGHMVLAIILLVVLVPGLFAGVRRRG